MRVSTKAALIGVAGGLLVLGISIAWDAFNKKPIIDYAFSDGRTYFSDPSMQSAGVIDPQDYVQLDFFMENRGDYDGHIVVNIAAEGAQVAFPHVGEYGAAINSPYFVQATKEWMPYHYYLKPTGSPQTITLTISVTGTDLFHQISPPGLNKLVYEKDGAGYRLRG